jgi:hypothetical protein
MITIPYTYKLIFKPTGQYYFGVRWANGCNPNDLWVKYFTSSKHIKKLIKEYGKDSFIVKVTKTFNNAKDAAEWETLLLTKTNASRNAKFINKANNMPQHSTKGLCWIHHNETFISALHDPLLEIPSGWAKGHSPNHKKANKIAHDKLYSSGEYLPWNVGGGKPTGPCSEHRKSNISAARLNTKKVICKHCDKLIDPGNYTRFHGNNCKNNPNVNAIVLRERSIKAKNAIIKQKENGTFKKPQIKIGNFSCPHCSKTSTNYAAMKRHHYDNCKFFNINSQSDSDIESI